MRKKILLLTMLLCLVFTIPAIAAPTVELNGQQLNFTDAQPTIENGRTLVPLRAIFEAMGATVDWDANTQTATAIKDNTTVILPIGSLQPTINGEITKLDVPAKIINGRTLAPLRFVGEAFGGEVGWDEGSQTITIFALPPSGTPPPIEQTTVKAHFIDVGQGDSILIQLSTGKNILIDAGETSAPVINYLTKNNIKKLDVIIATHPHADHIGGMTDIVKAFDVGSFYMPRTTHTTKTYENLLLTVKDKGLKITETKAGLSLDIGKEFKAYFVAPNSATYNNLNNYSAVLKLEHKGIAFLLTGDAEDLSENEMLKHNIKANLLKIGHHGSNTSTTNAFLNAVNPNYAVISVGKDNKYGHPNSETLEKLNSRNIKIYRTDKQGTIIATSNGSNITFNTNPTEVITNPIPAPTGQYIGNKNTKKFHLPTCKSLPSEVNRVYFTTREEVINQGYSPCGNCKP